MKHKDGKIRVGDYATDHTLPYPDTDFSPAVQRAIQRKIESGEDEGIDRDEFFRLLGKVAQPQEPDQ